MIRYHFIAGILLNVMFFRLAACERTFYKVNDKFATTQTGEQEWEWEGVRSKQIEKLNKRQTIKINAFTFMLQLQTFLLYFIFLRSFSGFAYCWRAQIVALSTFVVWFFARVFFLRLRWSNGNKPTGLEAEKVLRATSFIVRCFAKHSDIVNRQQIYCNTLYGVYGLNSFVFFVVTVFTTLFNMSKNWNYAQKKRVPTQSFKLKLEIQKSGNFSNTKVHRSIQSLNTIVINLLVSLLVLLLLQRTTKSAKSNFSEYIFIVPKCLEYMCRTVRHPIPQFCWTPN